MKFKFIESNEEEIIAYGKKNNSLIKIIENMCLQDDNKIIGYYEDRIKELNPNYIECFVTANDRVYAVIGNTQYLIKRRLYELNDILNDFYIFINQGCLANINQIDHFSTNIGGALLVVFKSGYKDYVSRRQLKNVKERLGLKK